MRQLRRFGLSIAISTLSACTAGGSARSMRVELTLAGDQLTIERVSPSDEEAPALAQSGDIGVTLRSADGLVLAQGFTSDRRHAWGETEAPQETVTTSALLVPEMTFALLLPMPPGGRGELMLGFESPSGGRMEASAAIVSPPMGAVASSAPLIESGDLGASRAALDDIACPTQQYYNDWPDSPEDPRTNYRGCGTMEHLGGVEDPRGALLVLFYPSTGWGSGNLDGFRSKARAIVNDALAGNEWFRDHREDLSFYAIMDATVADHATTACACCGDDDGDGHPDCTCGLTQSATLWSEGGFLWRAKGAHYGPVPRGSSIEPDLYVALRSDYCDGWAMDATANSALQTDSESAHIVLGSDFGCHNTRAVDCPIGARLAHEMGHALGGLADEYGGCGDGGYPNYQAQDTVSWGCHIGETPPVLCPDDNPPSRHSYLRQYGPSCANKRPCSDSLMMGFYSNVLQFDAVSYDAMTTGLNRELGASWPLRLSACGAGTIGTCGGTCDDVDCGTNGCDAACACSCRGSSSVCTTAIGTGVCNGAVGCGRTDGLANGSCPGVLRSDRDYIVGTCQNGHWVASSCDYYPTEIVNTCLAAVGP